MEIRKPYHTDSDKKHLSASDWMVHDRKRNSSVWQEANRYNLINNLSQEYTTLVQRRDFYKWLDTEISSRGHKVIWFKMAYFITDMLHSMEVFPFSFIADKNILNHAHHCSASIFNLAFVNMKELYQLTDALDDNQALQWDKAMLNKEQFLWVDRAVASMDLATIKKIENILQGKFLYGLLVPKEIRYYDRLSNNTKRYEYALKTLRPYCGNVLK